MQLIGKMALLTLNVGAATPAIGLDTTVANVGSINGPAMPERRAKSLQNPYRGSMRPMLPLLAKAANKG